MSGSFRLSVPSEVAHELIAEGVAREAFTPRGVGDVVTVIVEIVNTGASVVTVSAAGVAVRKASQRLARYLRTRHGEGDVQVVIQGPKGERTLRIRPSTSEEDTAEAVLAAVEFARSGAATPGE